MQLFSELTYTYNCIVEFSCHCFVLYFPVYLKKKYHKITELLPFYKKKYFSTYSRYYFFYRNFVTVQFVLIDSLNLEGHE